MDGQDLAVELLLNHDGDDRCGCLSGMLVDILLGDEVDIPQQVQRCYREHLGWDRQAIAEALTKGVR
jgi:hypothetical protein